MYTLYYSPETASMCVHQALIEANAQYRLLLVDLQAGQQRDPAYLRLNPGGVVPTLLIDRHQQRSRFGERCIWRPDILRPGWRLRRVPQAAPAGISGSRISPIRCSRRSACGFIRQTSATTPTRKPY
jgi:hypothetical protein